MWDCLIFELLGADENTQNLLLEDETGQNTITIRRLTQERDAALAEVHRLDNIRSMIHLISFK